MTRAPLLWLALACHVLLATGYLVSTPLYEAPDENSHFYYATYLSHRGSLPRILQSVTDGQRHPADEAEVAHHPPLYYGLLAATRALTGDGDTMPHAVLAQPPGVLHFRHGYDEVAPVSREVWGFWALRAWSVLCGAVTLVLTFRLGRVAFPDHPAVAGVATLLLACLPQWSFMHGALDNGNLAATLCHATVLAAVVLVVGRTPTWRTGVLLGGLVGLALMTKLTSMLLPPLVAVAYAHAFWTRPAARRATCLSALAALGVAAALAGWFFVRNKALYGEWMALSAHKVAYAASLHPEGTLWGYLTGAFLPALFESTIASYGWGTVTAPTSLQLAVLALLGTAAAGWIVRRREPLAHRVPLLLLGLSCVLVFGVVLRFNLAFAQPQGRYLFPAIGCFAVLVAAGLVSLGRALPWLRHPAVRAVLVAAPVVIAGVMFFGVFRPGFGFEPAAAGPYHASAVARMATPVDRARIEVELLAPEDGAKVEGAPVFRWQSSADGRYSVQVYTEEGRILFASEWLTDAPLSASFAVPEVFWQSLPEELGEMTWQVRGIPDRSKGEEVAGMIGSAGRVLRRR